MDEITPDIPTYIEGLELELHFAIDAAHKAEIVAEIARVGGGTPAAPAPSSKSGE